MAVLIVLTLAFVAADVAWVVIGGVANVNRGVGAVLVVEIGAVAGVYQLMTRRR